MKYTSINPYTGETVENFKSHSESEIKKILTRSESAFRNWEKVPLDRRARLMDKAGKVLRKNKDIYARVMTAEMGKPIGEARAEIEKCAWVCAYYAENASEFLKDEKIKTDAGESFVRHNPIGTIFAVMPWNYPFWQVFRFAAPTLTAGNTGLLKHARNVLGCAEKIAEVFDEAGFPEGVFQNVFTGHDKTEMIISHPAIKAVTLTGSEGAGKSVASLAGKYLKRSLLELGGSNAFVVLEDADLDKIVPLAIQARMMNTGQSCIAAKRFVIVDEIYDAFTERFIEGVIALKSGDPMDEDTDIGPLARTDLAEIVEKQVQESVKKGAVLRLGGKRHDAYFEPTVLENVKAGMPVFDEEVFGPVAPLIRAKNTKEAFEIARNTDFALGISVCTGDVEEAKKYIDGCRDGAFFVNELVKSDPRLPFGGQKKSGYGRELSRDGIRAFVNRQTVYIK